jgi:hypothetical protein
MMKRSEELQYISDTLFIESLALDHFNKQASIMDSLGLDSVASSIGDFVKENLSMEGGIGKGVGNILLTGAIFRVHPLLGVINSLASAAGFGITDVISYIYNAISGKIESGQPISQSEISQLGKEATKSIAGPLEAEAGNDFFYGFKKQAYGSGYGFFDKIKVLPGGSGSLLTKLLGGTWWKKSYLGKRKIHWLLGGLATWIVTTVLMGAGLVAASGAVTGLLGIKKEPAAGTKKEEVIVQETKPADVVPEVRPESRPESKKVTIHDTGFGTKNFPNDMSNVWIVPIDGSVSNTLLDWTFRMYPDLEILEDEIKILPSFNKTLYELEVNHKSSRPDQLVMPQKYHSLREVVDKFSPDAISLLES